MHQISRLGTQLILASIGGCCAMAALAVEPPPVGPIPFNVYDQDKNGSVSEAEFASVQAKRLSRQTNTQKEKTLEFSDLDLNKDGQLSRTELTVGSEQRRSETRRSAPTVSRGIVGARVLEPPTFEEFDANKDGKIQELELYQGRAKRISANPYAGYSVQNTRAVASFADIDTNGDGGISKKEFSQYQSKSKQQKMQK